MSERIVWITVGDFKIRATYSREDGADVHRVEAFNLADQRVAVAEAVWPPEEAATPTREGGDEGNGPA